MNDTKNRRDFLKILTIGSVGALTLSKTSMASSLFAGRNYPAVGIQLYTVRDALNANAVEALRKVAQLGYKNLELAGYSNGKFYGMEPSEFKKVVSDLGMTVISSHTGVEVKGVDTGNAQKMADDHAKIGVKYCIQPWLVPERRKTADMYKQFVSELNLVAEVMKKAGIQFGYHNHAFEFETVDGIVPYYDIYMKNTDPSLLTFELDIYWATKAGQDPIEIFKKYPGRFQLWHVKDMEKGPEQFFAPVGSGTIDYKKIFNHQETSGMKYFFVEQDATRDNKPFDAIKTSIDNLKQKILI
ncbi:MAG TPA: sugar phosphate isomerase/epimerase [Bacteroidales bacterium]|nr:sugar phosphate isomerase/epimerase [Bacteroidales bacterium]